MKHLWIVCAVCLDHLTNGECKSIGGWSRVKHCARCDSNIEHKSQYPVSSIIKKKLDVLGARVVIKVDPAETVTKGGIIIPESAQKKALKGRIVAMGPGMRTIKGGRWPMPDVVIGSRVLFIRETGSTFVIDDVALMTLHDDDLLAEDESEAA